MLDRFLVLTMGFNPDSEGLYQMVLVSESGETYRTKLPQSLEIKTGDLVLRSIFVDLENTERLENKTEAMTKSIWSEQNNRPNILFKK